MWLWTVVRGMPDASAAGEAAPAVHCNCGEGGPLEPV